MLTEVLDSNPGANISFPAYIPLNASPAYKGKLRGMPILGQCTKMYTHFVPVRGASDHVKDLLEIPDTDTEQYAPIEANKELLKEEKIVKGEEKTAEQVPDIMTQKFKHDAKEYLQTTNATQEESYVIPSSDAIKTNTKTDSEIATIIASAAPIPKPRRKRSKPQVKAIKKRSPPKSKKMSQFRIIKKKK